MQNLNIIENDDEDFLELTIDDLAKLENLEANDFIDDLTEMVEDFEEIDEDFDEDLAQYNEKSSY